MATLGGGWIHPLVGAQYFAPASADGIPIVQKTRAVGSEGRAQNIAPLQLIRCLIVECGGMGMPPIRCPTVCGRRVFFGGADFFFAKRLFFRYGEGCEGRASRATVAGEWGYNGENSFSAFIPIRLPTIGRQPSHPHRSGFFFVSCHVCPHL